MTFAELWNEIVSEYNDNLNCKEEIIQKSWEILFKLCFGYQKTEIDPQRPVQMGVATKRADIVIKDGNSDLFVVELKRHMLHEGQEQLFSYLNQLKIDLGILVCDKLYIYDYDYTSKDNTYSFLEIPFTPDNPNGSRFVELFSKDNFDKQKIRDFIKESNDKKNAESEIKNELSANLISELLKKYFSEKFPGVNIERVLSDYNISITKKSAMTSPVEPVAISPILKSTFVPSQSAFGTKDATQYMINGSPTGGKGPTVYAAVKLYVDTHNGISFSELQNAFPDYLAKPGFGKMIRRIEEVTQKEWSGSRYNKHPIILSDGTQIVVTNQWNLNNMSTFLAGAAKLGIDIKPL